MSPSQSRITKIRELENYNYIRTYLSPLDLHFQVSPIRGKVVSIESIPGKTDLERIKVGIMNSNGRVVFVEQAVKKFGYWGYLSNIFIGQRVIINVKIGDELEQGERYGIVRFGSEMAYYIPKNFRIVVKEGQKCQIGQTKIAKLK
jgi:phosphatidylserine decarboxylase